MMGRYARRFRLGKGFRAKSGSWEWRLEVGNGEWEGLGEVRAKRWAWACAWMFLEARGGLGLKRRELESGMWRWDGVGGSKEMNEEGMGEKQNFRQFGMFQKR